MQVFTDDDERLNYSQGKNESCNRFKRFAASPVQDLVVSSFVHALEDHGSLRIPHLKAIYAGDCHSFIRATKRSWNFIADADGSHGRPACFLHERTI